MWACSRRSSVSLSPAVMFVCCSPDVFRRLMIEFWNADLPHEQYVFLFIDLFADSLRSRHPWARGDQDDAIAKEAFQVQNLQVFRSRREVGSEEPADLQNTQKHTIHMMMMTGMKASDWRNVTSCYDQDRLSPSDTKAGTFCRRFYGNHAGFFSVSG